MHNPNGKYVHEPNEKNGYFPPETIEECRKDFMKVISHFPKHLIRKLKVALSRREVNGPFAWSDLLGTLARLQGNTRRAQILMRRLQLYQLVGRNSGLRENNFEYWFFQISGKQSLGAGVDRHLCRFTQITIGWCEKFLKSKKLQKKK